MKRLLFVCLMALTPGPLAAQAAGAVTEDVVTEHILPRFDVLSSKAQSLASAAQDNCVAGSESLRAAYGEAFDAWIAASHLRFGPTEDADRGYALAFWPDSRGATPKTLSGLITSEDAVAQTEQVYRDVSIAARGFYALEFLLFDPAISSLGSADYRCTLTRTLAADIAATADEIDREWQTEHAARLITPSATGPYRSDDEALQVIYKSLTTGLQFTSDARLGRPLGTFDRPRPKRAEVWRSGRSARHVALSLDALQDLAVRLAGEDADLAERLAAAFDHAKERLAGLDDPIFAGVAAPQSRIRIEAVQQAVDDIRDLVAAELGPRLGVSAGFNALDGD
ncbi:imelysin family protein [Roseovarius pelagicus]|uniref:Imelysin family protein n=1 Tax=Roseovarius pelagicus TaxID=2980108 RepID=A0ABY6D801_9RHOB|nr:imelysin family protein [Roseovarius pelagicus]UXX82240.1 imelysin family protein [Roseovarius pelagicus]